MARILSVLFFVFLAAPVVADDIFCEQPWFTRNLIFDRAGHCFDSALGMALFDNSDCTPGQLDMPERDQAAVAMIRELEQVQACSIDTSRTTLEHLSSFEYLRQMDVIPIPVEHESGCIGYLGEALSLRTGPSNSALHLDATIQTGMDILFGHLAEGDWDFVTVYSDNWETGPLAHGWTRIGGHPPECRQYAG